jgi:hypothetical protein
MEESRINDKRICSDCGSTSTYRNQWYKHNDFSYCKRCQNKIFVNPKWHPITNTRKIRFKGRFIYLKENPRKGICNWCHRKIGDIFINARRQLATVKKTDIHHIEYHENDPLKDTLELCNSCHNIESWRLGQRK